MPVLISFIAGIIFSIGLIVSGMTNPHKVIGFLDVFGNWDYSLVLVLTGAVGVNFVTFKFITSKAPLCGGEHFLPTSTKIDRNLILGSAMFGIGWGTLGICPGPGIVNLVTLSPTMIIFVLSMLIGMLIYKYTQ